jgi:hypothetical protein
VDQDALLTMARRAPSSKPASTAFLGGDVDLAEQRADIDAATFWPFSALMSKIATFTPAASKACAEARPRPDAPPVTTAESDESIFMLFLQARVWSQLSPRRRPVLNKHPAAASGYRPGANDRGRIAPAIAAAQTAPMGCRPRASF